MRTALCPIKVTEGFAALQLIFPASAEEPARRNEPMQATQTPMISPLALQGGGMVAS
jgi:hypothetical protein